MWDHEPHEPDEPRGGDCRGSEQRREKEGSSSGSFRVDAERGIGPGQVVEVRVTISWPLRWIALLYGKLRANIGQRDHLPQRGRESR